MPWSLLVLSDTEISLDRHVTNELVTVLGSIEVCGKGG